jgi:hypothetical protein
MERMKDLYVGFNFRRSGLPKLAAVALWSHVWRGWAEPLPCRAMRKDTETSELRTVSIRAEPAIFSRKHL